MEDVKVPVVLRRVMRRGPSSVGAICQTNSKGGRRRWILLHDNTAMRST